MFHIIQNCKRLGNREGHVKNMFYAEGGHVQDGWSTLLICTTTHRGTKQPRTCLARYGLRSLPRSEKATPSLRSIMLPAGFQ